ncbi:glycosyltransferase family 2 protein [uncultured Desulfosarcina sp.]|uniref:glycosyltransferase family 2 protein n=1 Tax=uncultured Desulfosarcina sp. TaxID=218289 RepID=UPI0029C6CAD7|nr:glycosyltransferase family 2 protein [uncultured Desulfosarcina sp.]
MLKNRNHSKISIVTPSFNQGQYIEAAISSVLSQGYPNLEYIIIDGGSTDNSVEIIRRYSNYLHFWCSEPDNGHYAAVNKGFEKATGDIFFWLNSDDMLCPDALETVGSIFSEFSEIAWLTTLQQFVWDSDGKCQLVKHMPGYSRDAFLDGHYMTRKFSGFGFIQQESTFWRRVLWEKVGGIRTSFALAGDFDLWARFFFFEKLYGVDQPLGGFRIHDKNRSRQANRYLHEAERSLEEMRRKLNWPVDARNNLFQGIINKWPALRRVAKYFNIAFSNKYVGENIFQRDPSEGRRCQLKTVSF